MTRDELLAKLKAFDQEDRFDPDRDHRAAVEALLEYINDVDITASFNPDGP